MPLTPPEVERYLHDHIPLSAAMCVAVVRADAGAVVLRAPLAPNINHRSTGFGGSASALAILSAWAWMHGRLRERGFEGRLVIQRNAMTYTRPITGAFTATCGAPGDDAWERLTAALDRHGRGRLELHSVLHCGGEEVGRFVGTYVALAPEAP